MNPPCPDKRSDATEPVDSDEDERNRQLIEDLDPESPGFAERHPDLYEEIKNAKQGISSPGSGDYDIPF